jgi:hypothetical protein
MTSEANSLTQTVKSFSSYNTTKTHPEGVVFLHPANKEDIVQYSNYYTMKNCGRDEDSLCGMRRDNCSAFRWFYSFYLNSGFNTRQAHFLDEFYQSQPTAHREFAPGVSF